ncbi:MAG: serine hydrolase [Lachnospiraceae bacterium]|nr:serine hydrolase [Lachnospiraceae bacterium]
MEFIETYVQRTKAEGLGVLYANMRRDGRITEEYAVCPNKTRLNAMSVSKSFASAAAGIAIREGLIGLDELICDAFADYVPDSAPEELQAIRVRHMLTMTSGLKDPLFFADSPERYTVKDWTGYFFRAAFDAMPGEKFVYSNFNTYIVSALIETRAGCNLLNYLRNRLFEPIGIGNPDWTLSPEGHVYAANGLYLTIDELSLYGELLLRGGNWNGVQLIPEDYVRAATTKQVETVTRKNVTYEESFGYGYQFWMTPIPDTFLMSGNYGQYCLVMPQKGVVLSVMSFEGSRHKRIRDILLEEAAKL